MYKLEEQWDEEDGHEESGDCTRRYNIEEDHGTGVEEFDGEEALGGVVKMETTCPMLKRRIFTTQATNVPIVRPQFQAQVVPPNVKARMKETKIPAFEG